MEEQQKKSRWTPEQQRAIEERDCNLLVAAAAGAGKTAVLVERIIGKITDESNPIDIDKLLVVTFTNAAAAEMRERIGDAIAARLEKQPDSRLLQKQLLLLNKASITTIHSFCLEVIRNNFHSIDLDPGFRIADETEAELLKQEALEELFEDMYGAEVIDAEFIRLLESYGSNRDDMQLQQMVLSIYEFVQSSPWPEKWLRQSSADFDLREDWEFVNTPQGRVIREYAAIELQGLAEAMASAAKIILKSQGLDAYNRLFENELQCINTLWNLCKGADTCWDTIFNEFSRLEFERLPKCAKDADKEAQERVKKIRDSVKARLRKLREDYFYAESSVLLQELQSLSGIISCLCSMVLDFEKRYKAKKQEKGIVDFNDLEHYCLAILAVVEGDRITSTQSSLNYRDKFEEIFIDEYQDSNLVQEVILNIISRKDIGKPNIFMVGDVKQSIYRFRQAKPELFMDKYNSYSEDRSGDCRKILLYKNFRSRDAVINAVNYVFTQVMSESVGEISYNDKEALVYGASYQEDDSGQLDKVELHLVDMGDTLGDSDAAESLEESGDDGTEAPEEEEIPEAARYEARLIIKQIRKMLGLGGKHEPLKIFDKDKGQHRTLEYKDMVILLRSTKNWCPIITEELLLNGIPVYADTGTGFFRTVEIETVMSLLMIIDNPDQDIPMLAVLRSPIIGLSPEELIDIRIGAAELNYYEALKAAVIKGGALGSKIEAFLERLERWRNKACYTACDEMIWMLITETGYYSYVGAMAGGVQRQANLRMLFEKARQYEETSYKGLFNFINFVNRLKGSKGDLGSAKVLGENDNVVRVMSIHKSKGLEFPVVFLAGNGKGFNMMDMNKSILLHQDLGFGPDYADSIMRLSYPTIYKQALRCKTKLESLSEEMRILYVALTRAKEKLILIGTVRDMKSSAAKWCSVLETREDKLPAYEMLRAKSYLDWICPALSRHVDGAALRELYKGVVESGCTLVEGSSKWLIKVWNKASIPMGDRVDITATQLIDSLKELKEDVEQDSSIEQIRSRLQWQYPYRAAEKLPVKVTVTELKRKYNTAFEEEFAGFDRPLDREKKYVSDYVPQLVKRPKFLEERRELSAAEKGTALHFVMQHLDLSKISSMKDIALQVKEMLEKELLTPQEAASVNAGKIMEFLQTSLGRRLLRADKVYREIPFNIQFSSADLFEELKELEHGDSKILLQGVIDCYFEEDGKIVLLDYKTDYVEPDGLEKIKEKYRLQLDYYAKALEAIRGIPVKERCIYLFWSGATLVYE